MADGRADKPDVLSSERRYCLVMPFLDEAEHLSAVLTTLEAQTYDRAAWRLIAVDNGSTDGGPALVEAAFAGGGLRGTIVQAAIRSIPVALNAGLAHVSPDEAVIRLDAHTLYDPDYIATIDRAFKALPDDAWCVGGAPDPLAAAEFGKALQVALYTNRFGLGPADFRSAASSEPVRVSTVYLGAWRPGILQRMGGFNDAWQANEDCELSERIAAAGGKTYRIPLRSKLIVTRGPATTIRKFGRYGFWRAQTFKRFPRAIRLRHVVPPVVLMGTVALACSGFRLALGALYLLYALGTIRSRQSGERWAVTAGSLVFFPLVHSAYALGLLVGAFRSPALEADAHAARTLEPLVTRTD